MEKPYCTTSADSVARKETVSTEHANGNFDQCRAPKPNRVADTSTEPRKPSPAGLPEVSIGPFPTTPGNHQETINNRQFEVHIPKGYDGHSPLKVMYMFHGFDGSIDEMRKMTSMDQLADQRGFAVVYLQSKEKAVPGTFGLLKMNGWNLDHGTATEKDPKYDDMPYIRSVMQAANAGLHVEDPKKDVFLAGYSEGGMVAQYLAEQMPVAGVATVNSTILDRDPAPKSTDSPTKFMSVVGEDDNFLPMYGGHGWFSQGRPLKGFMLVTFPYLSQSQPLQQAKDWATANSDASSQTTEDKHNKTTLYSGGKAPVEQIIHKSRIYDWGLQGGMHEWSNGTKQGWWGVREADPTENDSLSVVNFFGL